MKKITLFLLLACLGFSKITFAQTIEEEAEVLYENAEKAYDNKAYADCEIALDKCIQKLGSTNPKIDYLRIRNLYDEVTNDESKATLDNYTVLQNAIADFFQKVNKSTYPEEKYKQIISIKLAIPDKLNHYQQVEKEKQMLQQQIDELSKITGIPIVFVQGGSFDMGSNDGEADEKPVHHVTLSSFYMGKYEVTQAQWKAIMGNNPSDFRNCDDCPVENVSWEDIQGFIEKLNQKTGKRYRLPTEAEWEYAARGGSKSKGYTYSGSNDINSVAWYTDNSGNKTHPVGQKQANELGIYDMSGNILECCQDFFDANYYANSPSENPMGSSLVSSRVARGGCWRLKAESCRVAHRYFFASGFRLYDAPGYRGRTVGFRLVLVP